MAIEVNIAILHGIMEVIRERGVRCEYQPEIEDRECSRMDYVEIYSWTMQNGFTSRFHLYCDKGVITLQHTFSGNKLLQSLAECSKIEIDLIEPDAIERMVGRTVSYVKLYEEAEHAVRDCASAYGDQTA